MKRTLLIVAYLAGSTGRAEERQFAVTVDGKPAGEMRMSFKSQADGSTMVSIRMELKGEKRVSFRGTEVWKDSRLVRLDGERKGVTLRATDRGYDLKGPTREVTVRGEVWPDTFAVRPKVDAELLVVDVRTGDVHRSKVELLGPDRVTIAGRPVPATRYRVTFGGGSTDVWFDDRGRLVRGKCSREGRVALWEAMRIVPD
jgi:hypothetical protein